MGGTDARIAVVGGGVAGLSTLYHLARAGVTDAVLLEQHELTSGTTWHAAGLCTQYSTSSTLMRALRASVDLYRELEADTGQAVGFHPTGSLRLAPTRDHLDELRHVQGVAEVAGVPYGLISPEEAREKKLYGSLQVTVGIKPDGTIEAFGDTLATPAGVPSKSECFAYTRQSPVSEPAGGVLYQAAHPTEPRNASMDLLSGASTTKRPNRCTR